MQDIFNYTEVPYLQEILNFLPINPVDEEDVIGYINNVSNLVMVNYKYEQYQFAYFGIHLLYMTFIYCSAWKISQIKPERYKDVIVFARSYNGREKDLKIEDAESIFSYSLIPEKDIAKIFNIIELDKSQISFVGNLVDARNEMAHASGKFDILTSEGFDSKVHSIFISIKNIHKGMENVIKVWYKKMLLKYCDGKLDGYDAPSDIITELMIQSFKLSVKELLFCSKISLKDLIASNMEYKEKLQEFKNSICNYCNEMEYID